MGLKEYGVLRGQAVDARRNNDANSPHYQVRIRVSRTDYWPAHQHQVPAYLNLDSNFFHSFWKKSSNSREIMKGSQQQRSSIIHIILVISLMILSGCTGVSQAELRVYSDTFTQAQDASYEIYRSMLPALLAGGASQASGFPVSLGPETFDRSGCDPEIAAFTSLQARCAALAAVRSFNQAMLDLQAGMSVSVVQAQLASFESNAGILAGLIGAPGVTAAFATAQTLFPALKAVARELTLAADRAALKAHFDQARPLVEQLLEALQEDVPRIYQVMRAYYDQRLQDLDLMISDGVGPALLLANSRSLPVDTKALAARQALDARFETLFGTAEPAPSERLLGLQAADTAASPFNVNDAEQVDTALDAVEPILTRFHQTVREWQSYREALDAYDLMLGRLRQAFATLAAASDNPFAAGGGSAQFLESALTIREQATNIQQHLAASR